ncbi:MAG: hypothetical protein E7223_03410 [Clostridiales bacterium]|nr:hypothetical protein [Clostridiales bacterium]
MKKRLLAIVLAVAMLFSMAACGSAIDETSMDAYENYAILAAKQDTYKSYEDIDEVLIQTGDALKATLGSLPGQMEALDLSKVGALVLVYTSSHQRYFLIDAAAAESIYTYEKSDSDQGGDDGDSALGGSGKQVVNNALVIYKGGTNYATAAANQDPKSELKSTYSVNMDTTATDLRWDLAQKQLDYENYLKKPNTEKNLAEYKDAMAEIQKKENYFHDEDWLRLCAKNSTVKQCHTYEREIYRLSGWLSIRESYEKDTSADKDTKFANALLAFMKDWKEETDLLNKKLSLQNYLLKMEQYETDGAAAESGVADRIAALQKEHGDAYILTTDYYYLRQLALEAAAANKKSGAYTNYESARYYALRQRLLIEQTEKVKTMDDETEVTYSNYSFNEMQDYRADFRGYAISYAEKQRAYEKFLETNKADIDIYNAEAEKIKAKYKDTSYENDLEYMKLQLRYKDLLEDVADYAEDLEELQKKIDQRTEDNKKNIAGYEEKLKNALHAKKVGRDKEKINAVLAPLAQNMKAAELKVGNRDKYDPFMLDKNREGWVVSSPEYAEDLMDHVTVQKSSSGGGSSGKTCAMAGCTKKAVTSGDSVYCSTHSRRCGNCGCYIDADAMFCMDCIKNALKK